MRLIDADRLSEEAKEYFISPDGALRLIERQPTAFDLESAIERLKENEEDVLKAIEENSKSEFEMIKIRDLKELFEEYTREQIEILKSAANATNGKNGG